jgi:hypothetical protein
MGKKKKKVKEKIVLQPNLTKFRKYQLLNEF